MVNLPTFMSSKNPIIFSYVFTYVRITHPKILYIFTHIKNLNLKILYTFHLILFGLKLKIIKLMWHKLLAQNNYDF